MIPPTSSCRRAPRQASCSVRALRPNVMFVIFRCNAFQEPVEHFGIRAVHLIEHVALASESVDVVVWNISAVILELR